MEKRYEELFEDGYGHGEDIRILFESEARAWVEEHLSADEYCKIFGELEEG